MNHESLLVDIDTRGVATVTLNRPEKHNAFDEKLIASLSDVFSDIADNERVRLVVLKGAGKSFCAGGDLNWMRSMKDYSLDENMADAKKLAQMFIALRRLPQPVVGVIQGIAFGGGSGLAALCDYVVAADDARFGFTEARLGLLPATISPFVIEKIGVSAARAHFLSGAPFDAAEALRIGLIHKTARADTLEDVAETAVQEFLKAGPEAAKHAKQMIDKVTALMQNSQDVCSAEVTNFTAQAIAAIRTEDEAQEGMGALLDKRSPKWSAA